MKKYIFFFFFFLFVAGSLYSQESNLLKNNVEQLGFVVIHNNQISLDTMADIGSPKIELLDYMIVSETELSFIINISNGFIQYKKYKLSLEDKLWRVDIYAIGNDLPSSVWNKKRQGNVEYKLKGVDIVELVYNGKKTIVDLSDLDEKGFSCHLKFKTN